MPSQAKLAKHTLEELDFLQREQIDSVKKLGKLRGKIEKRSRKVHELEAEMTRLEKEAHDISSPAVWADGKPAKGLRQALLVIHPLSGSFVEKAGSPERLVRLLRTHGIQAEVQLKTSGKEVRRRVREAAKAGVELVIVAGGDGTIEDVAFALVGSSTTLGILPTGTMNNLALSLGIPLDLEQACALVGAGITRQVDVGCIPATEKSKRTYFLETAGLGLSVALPAGQTFKKGLWQKFPEAVRKMFEVSPSQIQITLDSGETLNHTVKLVTVSNAPMVGMNNLIAPDAKMDDGLFDLGVYDGMSDLELARYFLSTARGQRACHPNVRFYRARRVHICAQNQLPATSDKDELAALDEIIFEVVPRALSVIAGNGPALTWPVDVIQAQPIPSAAEPAPPEEPQSTPTAE